MVEKWAKKVERSGSFDTLQQTEFSALSADFNCTVQRRQ
jgi:hypothetical protein